MPRPINDIIFQPGRRQRLVRGNPLVARNYNWFRYSFRDPHSADVYWDDARRSSGMDEADFDQFTAVSHRLVWQPRSWPGNLHGRKVRDWANLSERQRRRVSSNWAIREARRRAGGLTPRQWYEHGGDIRPIENRGYTRDYSVYIADTSDPAQVALFTEMSRAEIYQIRKGRAA